MKVFLLRVYKQITILLSLVIVFVAIILSLARAFTPVLLNHQVQLSDRLSAMIKQPVRIGAIETAWYGLEPVIRLDDIVLLDPKTQQPTVVVDSVDLGINIWRSLIKWQVQPGLIVVSGTKLALIENKNQEFYINGIDALPPFPLFSKEHQTNPFLQKILQIGHIYLNNINIDLYRHNQEPIAIQNFQFQIESENESHRIWGECAIQQTEKPAILNFIAEINGNINKPAKLKSELYIQAQNISLAEWLQQYHPYSLALQQGRANLKVWFAWSKSKLQSVIARFAVRSVAVTQTETKAHLKLRILKADINWHLLRHGGWSLTGENVRIIANNENWPLAEFYLKEPLNTKEDQIFYLSYFKLDPLLPFLQHWPQFPDRVQELLQHLQPRGELSSFIVTRQKSSRIFLVSSRFKNVTLNAWEHIPAVNNLSGRIVFSATHGKMAVASNDLSVNFENMFNGPLFFKQFQTQLNWVKQGNHWKLRALPIYGYNDAIGVHGEMTLILSANKNPVVNAILGFSNFDLANMKTYLPVKVMSPKLVEWLTQSIKSGKATYTTVLLRGPLETFPFDHYEGIFAVNSNFQNLNLEYDPEWPMALDLTGDMQFIGRQIFINANSGNIINMPIQKISAEIPYVGHEQPEVVIINSIIKGDLKNALTFLKTGILKDKVGKNLKNLELQGPMNLQLGLIIPLKDTKGHIGVSGIINTENALLSVPSWNININNLSGELDFTQDSLYAKQMQGILFNNPVTLNVVTAADKMANPATVITADGQADMNQISRQFHVPVADYIHGVSAYKARLVLQHNDKLSNYLTVNTDLIGTTISLPKPLAKTADEAKALQLSAIFNINYPLQINFNYAQILDGALAFVKQAKIDKFYSGELSFNSKANYQQQQGLLIDGQLQELDWNDWLPFINNMAEAKRQAETQNQNSDGKNVIRLINLNIKKIIIYGQSFANTQVNALPNLNYWLANLSGPDVAGKIFIPVDRKNGTLKAQLERLYLQKTTTTTVSEKNTAPDEFPALQININDFRYDNMLLGALNLQTHTIINGLTIDRCTLTTPIMNLAVTGNWQKLGSQKFITTINGSFTANNLAGVLQAWQLPQFIDSSDAKINFTLAWPNSPFAANIAKTNGKLNIVMNDGRIIDLGQKANVDINLGRILTLLSVQSLPRRLIFDFSDLTKGGFSFNSWKGDLAITNGIATTNNTHIKGVIADLGITGSTDLTKQTVNLIVSVTPHVTANLPVLATLAGGPVAGVVTLVANQLLSPAVNKLAMRYYNIKGSWHQPIIQQLVLESSTQNTHY